MTPAFGWLWAGLLTGLALPFLARLTREELRRRRALRRAKWREYSAALVDQRYNRMAVRLHLIPMLGRALLGLTVIYGIAAMVQSFG